MRMVLVMIPLLLALAACGNESKIKDAVRQTLKDPSSAQFKDLVISDSGNRACVAWNAKNSMGGYGDWDIARLKKQSSGWVLEDMTANSQSCSQDSFLALDAAEVSAISAAIARQKADSDRMREVVDAVIRAQDDVVNKAVEKVRENKKVSTNEASKMIASPECASLLADIKRDTGDIAREQWNSRQSQSPHALSETQQQERVKNVLPYLYSLDCNNPNIRVITNR